MLQKADAAAAAEPFLFFESHQRPEAYRYAKQGGLSILPGGDGSWLITSQKKIHDAVDRLGVDEAMIFPAQHDKTLRSVWLTAGALNEAKANSRKWGQDPPEEEPAVAAGELVFFVNSESESRRHAAAGGASLCWTAEGWRVYAGGEARKAMASKLPKKQKWVGVEDDERFDCAWIRGPVAWVLLHTARMHRAPEFTVEVRELAAAPSQQKSLAGVTLLKWAEEAPEKFVGLFVEPDWKSAWLYSTAEGLVQLLLAELKLRVLEEVGEKGVLEQVKVEGESMAIVLWCACHPVAQPEERGDQPAAAAKLDVAVFDSPKDEDHEERVAFAARGGVSLGKDGNDCYILVPATLLDRIADFVPKRTEWYDYHGDASLRLGKAKWKAIAGLVALASEPVAPPAALDQEAAPLDIRRIPHVELTPSPYNPRRFEGKDADDLDLVDLSRSIRAKGQLQPCVVRPKEGGFEIVAGERRWRAVRLAGVATVACNVRELSDREAREICVTENLQRQDLKPIEEARGIATLIDGGMSAHEVAEKLGKDVSWVARRAKVATLSDNWQRLLVDPSLHVREWPMTTLEIVAILPQTQQDEFADRYHWILREDKIPTRDALKKLIGSFTFQLVRAPFDVADASLCPKAGACTSCPKRSSQVDLLFPSDDGKRHDEDRCTDADCWESKVAAFVSQRTEEARKEHGKALKRVTVMNGSAPKGVVHTYDLGAKVKAGTAGAVPAIAVDGEQAGEVLWFKEGPAAARRGGGRDKPKKLTPEQELAELEVRRNLRGTEILTQSLLDAVPPALTSIGALLSVLGAPVWLDFYSLKGKGKVEDIVDGAIDAPLKRREGVPTFSKLGIVHAAREFDQRNGAAVRERLWVMILRGVSEYAGEMENHWENGEAKPGRELDAFNFVADVARFFGFAPLVGDAIAAANREIPDPEHLAAKPSGKGAAAGDDIDEAATARKPPGKKKATKGPKKKAGAA